MSSKIQSILLVDDDLTVVQQAKNIFNARGVKMVMVAESYHEAIELLRLHRFDLVVVDLKMPMKGGYNLIQFIRNNNNYSYLSALPILVIYGKNLTPEESSLLQDYEISLMVKKPFADSVIIEKVFLPEISIDHYASKELDHDNGFLLIGQAIKQKDFSIAEAKISDRLSKNHDCPRSRTLRGKVFFERGLFLEAKKEVKNVLSNNPAFLPAFSLLAKIEVSIGNFREATSILEAMSKLSPLNTQRLLSLGELHLGFGRNLAAEEKFKKALEINNELVEAKYGLARSYLERGLKEDGLAIMKTLPDPDMIVSELNLKGVILAKSGHFDQAVSLYEKALQCSFNNQYTSRIQYNISLAFFKKRAPHQAMSHVEIALALDPNNEKAKVLKNKIKNRQYLATKINQIDLKESCFLTSQQIEFLLGRFHPNAEDVWSPKKSGKTHVINYDLV